MASEGQVEPFSRLALTVWWVISTHKSSAHSCSNFGVKIQNGAPANSWDHRRLAWHPWQPPYNIYTNFRRYSICTFLQTFYGAPREVIEIVFKGHRVESWHRTKMQSLWHGVRSPHDGVRFFFQTSYSSMAKYHKILLSFQTEADSITPSLGALQAGDPESPGRVEDGHQLSLVLGWIQGQVPIGGPPGYHPQVAGSVLLQVNPIAGKIRKGRQHCWRDRSGH